jgi:hypothetical protein
MWRQEVQPYWPPPPGYNGGDASAAVAAAEGGAAQQEARRLELREFIAMRRAVLQGGQVRTSGGCKQCAVAGLRGSRLWLFWHNHRPTAKLL